MGSLKHLRIVLAAVLMLPAVRLWAQAYDAAGPRELYHAEVCNQGRIPVDVAVAYKDFGFNDEFWIIDYWYPVAPGKCSLVFSHFYAPNNWASFQSFPLYLAFTFTDSTGVRELPVHPARHCRVARESLRLKGELQVSSEWAKPRRHQGAPKVQHPCRSSGNRREGCIPVNLVDTPHPRDSRSPSVQMIGPSRLDRRPRPLRSRKAPETKWISTKPCRTSCASLVPRSLCISGKYSLKVCVPPTVVKKESWANPPSARTRAFKETVRQFLSSHTFGAVTDGIARVRVTETGSKFVAEEVRACPNDYYFGLWSHQSDEQRAAAPLPAVKPAPQPAPGFGDQMGPGGFIKPLTK